jgi:hypothetical protein
VVTDSVTLNAWLPNGTGHLRPLYNPTMKDLGAIVYLKPGESLHPIVLRAKIASAIYCPKGCDFVLRVSENRKTLECDLCKAVYEVPTVEIRELH